MTALVTGNQDRQFAGGTPPHNARRGRHLIEDIHWPPGVKPSGYDACPITCSCGWSGKVGGWDEHRRSEAPCDCRRCQQWRARQ